MRIFRCPCGNPMSATEIATPTYCLKACPACGLEITGDAVKAAEKEIYLNKHKNDPPEEFEPIWSPS